MGSAEIMDVPYPVVESEFDRVLDGAAKARTARTRYVTINLDIAKDEPEWSGLTYGPFENYDQAVEYGNATMSLFAVNELIKPI